MPRFELTRYVTSLQKRCYQVEAPDADTARQRVQKGCAEGTTVGREAVLYRTQLDCKEVAAEAAPSEVRPDTDGDGCPVWVAVQQKGEATCSANSL